jgi:hypothetical protein
VPALRRIEETAMKESTILDSTGKPFATATAAEEGEKAQERREAMQRVIDAKRGGALVSYAGSFWRVGDVLDVGFFGIFAGPGSKAKRKRGKGRK